MEKEKVIRLAADFIKKASNSEPINKPIIVIAGPTATGKSALAIDIAKAINGYIINGDSRQVYAKMMIGTAQPISQNSCKEGQYDLLEIEGIKHFLYGFRKPSSPINVYDYKKAVDELVEYMQKAHPEQTPILVGGTGLYIDAIVFNFNLNENSNTDSKMKREELNSKSIEELHEILGNDVETLNESDKKNPHRLIRLIERQGKLFTHGKPMNYLYFIKLPEISEIEVMIDVRTNTMIAKGLLDENKTLRENPAYSKLLNATIGYKEFNEFLEGKITLEETANLINLHTRQYAKRQLTWFKRNLSKEHVIQI